MKENNELYVEGLEEKLEDWVPVVNPITWQILRFLESKQPRHIREFHESGFTGSPTTLEKYVEILEKRDFIESERESTGRHRRLIKLTEKGEKALRWIDELGELVKETG